MIADRLENGKKIPAAVGKLRRKLSSTANNDSPSTKQLIEAGAFLAGWIDQRRSKFQKACNNISETRLGFAAFDAEDSYELNKLPWIDADPERFVRAKFSSDFGRLVAEHRNREEAESDANK